MVDAAYINRSLRGVCYAINCALLWFHIAMLPSKEEGKAQSSQPRVLPLSSKVQSALRVALRATSLAPLAGVLIVLDRA